jgi:cyclase
VNSSAIRKPELITELAREFGSQCVVLAIDTKLVSEEWIVFVKGGREATERRTLEWAKEGASRGAGEILLTSMNHDGTKGGFALDITADVSAALPIPVIASGGAGTVEHFAEVFTRGKADAALAASIFHFGEIAIPDLKLQLDRRGVPVRLTR